MLRRIDKIAPFMVAALLGYLTYGSLEEQPLKMAEGKEGPVIGRKLLHPVLVEAQDQASPANRDPFEVEWDSYLHRTAPGDTPSSARITTTAPASAPATCPAVAGAATAPATAPAVAEVPPVPGPLVGVLLGEDITGAIIGDQIYKVGSTIGDPESGQAWVVDSIDADGVTLRCGQFRAELVAPEASQKAARTGEKPADKPVKAPEKKGHQ